MNKFDFPCDKDKQPLVSVTVTRSEHDYYDALQSSFFKSAFGKIGFYFSVAICGLFFLNVALTAALSKVFIAAVIYFILAVLFALLLFSVKFAAKKMAASAPNDSSFYSYSFYRHHFTFISDYNAAYIDYDLAARADENAARLLIFMTDGSVHIIPKKDIEKESADMLRAVMQNKLGSKFTVHTF